LIVPVLAPTVCQARGAIYSLEQVRTSRASPVCAADVALYFGEPLPRRHQMTDRQSHNTGYFTFTISHRVFNIGGKDAASSSAAIRSDVPTRLIEIGWIGKKAISLPSFAFDA